MDVSIYRGAMKEQREAIGQLNIPACFNALLRDNIPNLSNLLTGHTELSKQDASLLQRKLLTNTQVTTAVANLNKLHLFIGEPGGIESITDMAELLYHMDENISRIKLVIEEILRSDALKDIQDRRYTPLKTIN